MGEPTTKMPQESGLKLDLTDKSNNLPAKKAEEPKQSVVATKQWSDYLQKNIVNTFEVDHYVKLAILQNVPKAFVRFREIGRGKEAPYLEYEFAQKALNFAFNFDYDVEILKTGESAGASSKGTKYIEVTMEVKFTFRNNGKTITRTVFSGHKAYDNNATTKADCYKAALSKAYTVVARTFGIGSNVKGMTKGETNTYAAENVHAFGEIHQEQAQPVQKSFASGMGDPNF